MRNIHVVRSLLFSCTVCHYVRRVDGETSHLESDDDDLIQMSPLLLPGLHVGIHRTNTDSITPETARLPHP